MKIEKIKFKARRLDNGEWIIGSFVVMKIPALSKTTIGIVAAGGATLHEVDPSTICQFTGLRDKNGKEIWEGDYLTPINDSEAMKVIFKEGSFGFDTSYYGMRFHPLAQYDIREGNKLVELILTNRKEGEK